MRHTLAAFLVAVTWATPSLANDEQQPYAGLQARSIATLSTDDIADLEAGRGWGLALAAELNGYPGPTHVLEHAEALDLSEAQVDQVETIFEDMQAEAIAGGKDLIAAERALDLAFAEKNVTSTGLQELVQAAAKARGDLRFIHLSRHLQITDILNDQQIARYNVLRGYADDPCSSVPEGHNEAMWRRHNGCEN